MPTTNEDIDTTRASRAGHSFHERWTARRALQLVFPKDDLFAIAVEGVSSTEMSSPGMRAEEVADLVLYYGNGDNFRTCACLETAQFKYKLREEAVSAAYLKKTIEKFSDTIIGYEKKFSALEVDTKVSFIFVTNAPFSDNLWDAIKSLISGTTPSDRGAATQARNLKKWCAERGLVDASRLFSKVTFRAGEKSLAGQDNALRRTLTDWSSGADSEGRNRLLGLQDLVLRKAGPSGQRNNLIHREDVLDALDCEPMDLFPADTRFIDVGVVVERAELATVGEHIRTSELPTFIHAEGGVGKTVFIQSLAASMASEFEVVVFDCFGGGSYRSDNHSRHLPRIGLVQIINELASRTLCDPMLPGGDDGRKIIRAARKRLAQAADAICSQSKKLGLLIIVDASDNAQFEADSRHEDAFPKLLLASVGEDPIGGVKLLFTARTHRKNKVIGQTSVKEVELGPFTDAEALEFLAPRKANALDVELTTALARSGRNARVLDYLVQTWEVNVVEYNASAPITVREIIAQRCTKIEQDLRIAGWMDSEITEFFVAISLLPPPIPLDALANALGWSTAHVNTAASDLAPMLEVSLHGAIFRDEPTETFVREAYSEQPAAQRAIADRLMSSQSTSAYAAEALPHFLVVIKDSDRAFALADSISFPKTMQSEFGRRRLTLTRLRAAFRLAVAEDDFDRMQSLCMRLAQAATANIRGDRFIRESPALAILLGDADSYRRLFADRSGWRGARSARLTIAHQFAGDIEEAQIQRESTVRWINWNASQSNGGTDYHRAGPEVGDFVSVLFQHIVEGQFVLVDSNLAHWNDSFALSASSKLVQLLALFDQVQGTALCSALVSFTASDQCTSRALRLQFLSQSWLLSKTQLKVIAKAIEVPAPANNAKKYPEQEPSIESDRGDLNAIEQAAWTALLRGSRAAAAKIIRQTCRVHPSAYDYSERYGSSKIWPPIFRACVYAWSTGRTVNYHDLLPRDVKITRQARAISTKTELATFLKALREPVPAASGEKPGKTNVRLKFNDRQREDISEGIECALNLIRPLEDAALTKNGITSASVSAFLDGWGKRTRVGVHWGAQNGIDLLVDTIGLGCVNILLSDAPSFSLDQARTMIGLISSGRFLVVQKIGVLGLLARRPEFHEVAGEFALNVSLEIRRTDDIGQRGDMYLKLATAIMPMGIDEAREYYQQGLVQLDQIGGESYEHIYSLLHFASAQQGGFLKPVLGQRLMNLCQAIVGDEPSKFGWALFGRAAANSIGLSAIAKLVRWHDQDVANISYGLPQLACSLASKGHMDPRRAAYILSICEEHGWWDWHSWEAVADLLELSGPSDQKRIFLAFLSKLRAEHAFGGGSSVWEGLLKTAGRYPNAITGEQRGTIELLIAESKRKKDDSNRSDNVLPDILPDQATKLSGRQADGLIATLVSQCDLTSASSIDETLKQIRADDKLDYAAWQNFVARLRASCPYPKRRAFLLAICEATELRFSQAMTILTESMEAWSGSSAHLTSDKKSLSKRMFECKGEELFDGQLSDISRGIYQLSDFCDDKRFVLQLVLSKVAADEIELDGNEWLQLATALCGFSSAQSSLEALELLLSGPASRIADEIGEGPLRLEQLQHKSEAELFADVQWHLLGDNDGYMRWRVARGTSTLVELGLKDDVGLLLERFDRREITILTSADGKLSFQNSQQWLLMGLARAALHHGQVLGGLHPALLVLARRSDLHVINKVHIARCLTNIGNGGEHAAEVEALIEQIDLPPHGVVTRQTYPPAIKSQLGFRFDYDFTKNEIEALARLFNIAKETAEDAIATEIQRIWPEATSMDYFAGRERYSWDRGERYEFFREHVQRHALLSAASTLMKRLPLVIHSYESQEDSPWLQWRDRYDVSFNDGSWLSDWKDPVSQYAKENLLGNRIDRQESLKDQEALLRKLGFLDLALDTFVPLCGQWTSPDGVTVRITSALANREQAIENCTALAECADHDLWLPEYWDQGYYETYGRKKTAFSPLVWQPEIYGIGIDEGDEIAAQGAAARPRLGIELTQSLQLENAPNSGDWLTTAGHAALRSQVWGNWQADPDSHRYRRHNDGEILWATPDWLTSTLSALNQQLVYTIRLQKYRSSQDYDTSTGVKLVLIGLRGDDGTLRFWHAKKASKQDA
ncbi:hypothetical protein NC77_15865 [Janthinobacterium lividum]|uniref:hypothetical protein n=1 Tax=Janthinobacterium lividum TaxID=29581 RepID=UPI000536456F|nr:hypothetical protein [Janthinobacterium lividum]KHA77842.1 hypothetical protein NC77_15865 [Janthinobacterium lividum]